MTDDTQRQRQRKPKCGADQHDNDGTGENQILSEHPLRSARVTDENRDILQTISHQHDIRGFHRHIGASRAHRDAEVGNRERGRVVHPVADHHHGAFLFQLADDVKFVLGEEFGVDLIDRGFLGDGFGDEALVAC